MKGWILDYESFAAHDGPGIRMVVFLKGCPLRCIWCHAPESQSGKPELLYQEEHCLKCGRCQNVYTALPSTAFSAEQLDLASRCPLRAVSVAGQLVSAGSVIAEAEKNRIFFNESGGGLTVSGGEPLFQPGFTLEILKLAAEKNINCCIETCGFGSYDDLKRFIPYTGIFLYDYKHCDPDAHRKLTGHDNTLIMENLRKLNADGARIILRCPLIPGINDHRQHLHAIASLANEFDGIEAIHIEPFHPMARGKYQALKRPYGDLPEDFPSAATVDSYLAVISAETVKPVIIA